MSAVKVMEASGWKVARIPDPPFPNDLIVVTNAQGDHFEIVRGDQPVMWDYFAALATQPAEPAEITALRQQLTESERRWANAESKLAACDADLQAMQAKVDSLMLEYCPDEMTPEQVEEWGRNQARCAPEDEAAINTAVGIRNRGG